MKEFEEESRKLLEEPAPSVVRATPEEKAAFREKMKQIREEMKPAPKRRRKAMRFTHVKKRKVPKKPATKRENADDINMKNEVNDGVDEAVLANTPISPTEQNKQAGMAKGVFIEMELFVLVEESAGIEDGNGLPIEEDLGWIAQEAGLAAEVDEENRAKDSEDKATTSEASQIAKEDTLLYLPKVEERVMSEVKLEVKKF